MKKCFGIILFFLSTAILFAQKRGYEVFLKSGKKIPKTTSFKQLRNTPKSFNNSFYYFIQFNDIPNGKNIQNLKNNGIDLLSYIPNYTYISAVSTNLTNLDYHKYDIRTIFPINPSDKIDKRLVGGDLPDWAITGNKIKLVISYFKNLPQNEIIQALKQQNFTVLSKNIHIHAIKIEAPVKDLKQIALLPFVLYVSPINPPSQPEGILSRTLGRSNAIASKPDVLPYFNGKGVHIALQDDGDIGPHIDYQGRLAKNYCPIGYNIGDHGDHVAGILFGAGNKNPDGKGMAFGADLYLYAANTLQAFDSIYTHYYSDSIRIISTSYSDGCNLGYTSLAQQLDNNIRTMPDLMDVFSAGNYGSYDCGYGAGAGWGNITGGDKEAKNVITVGNLDYKSTLASTSSRGPAADGRIKPDVCAMGSTVLSTLPNNTYGYKSGTSMACPAVAGILAQLYQAYKSIYGTEPSSDIIKAAVLNSADDLGNSGPDFEYGWGRVNARKAYKIIKNNYIITDSVDNGEMQTHSINVPPNTAQMKIMLYWNDYEGTLLASRALVNDLDLEVKDPSNQTWLPWVLNSYPSVDSLSEPAKRGVDSLNNVEQVTINNPTSGNYTVKVAGSVVPEAPQKYVVVYEFIPKSITLTYPNGLEGFEPNTTETIRWDAYDTTLNFSLFYSLNNGINWQSIATNIPDSQRYYNWMIPDTVSGKVLVKISDADSFDISDTTFSIIHYPKNLKVDWVCPDSLHFSWDSVPNASAYEIYKLGDKYMDSLISSDTNSIVLHLHNPYIGKWLSVKSLGMNDAVSKRAIAIETPTTILNCSLQHDLKITKLESPVSTTLNNCFDLSQEKVGYWIKNDGTQAVNQYVVYYQINQGMTFSDTVNTTILPNDSALHIFSENNDFNTVGIYNIKTWLEIIGQNDNPYDDTTNFQIQVKSSNTIIPPYNVNFDTLTDCSTLSNCGQTTCPLNDGWINEENYVGDDIDWRVNSGSTPSAGTGPLMDYDEQTMDGKYLYLESSDCFNKTALLYSPCIDLSGTTNPFLAFAYNMFDQYDSAMGSLHVDAFVNGTWQNDIMPPFSGNHGQNWQTDTVSLVNYIGKTIMLRFRGITGSSYLSDIAIDDISILDWPAGIKKLNNAPEISVYPNPANTEISFKIENGNSKNQIIIYDDLGEMVLQSKSFVNQCKMNVSGISNGFYIIKIKSGNGLYYRKLIVQH